IFSIAPLLIVAVHIAGLVYGEDAARGRVVAHLSDTVGPDAARAIEDLIETAAQPGEGTWAAFIGLIATSLGALGLFLNLRNALSTIWKLEPPRGNTILGILLDYLLAIIMVLFTGVLLLASVAISTAFAAVHNVLPAEAPWQAIDMGVSF